MTVAEQIKNQTVIPRMVICYMFSMKQKVTYYDCLAVAKFTFIDGSEIVIRNYYHD